MLGVEEEAETSSSSAIRKRSQDKYQGFGSSKMSKQHEDLQPALRSGQQFTENKKSLLS